MAKFQHERLAKMSFDLEKKLKQASESVEEAYQFGDHTDSAEFETAISDEHLTKSRLAKLTGSYGNYEVVDTSKIIIDRVRIGTTVELVDLDNREEVTVNIVGVGPVKLENKEISYKTPFGATIYLAEAGEEREVKINMNKKRYMIKSISRYLPEE